MNTDSPSSTPVGARSGPLPHSTAWRAVARCVVESVRMLTSRAVHWPRINVGRRLRFADGTTGEVYRETAVSRAPHEACLLVVCFRLRLVRGRGHVLFRWESWLNTPLFVGFPGFVSKLWLAADEQGRYRGIYEWDGADRAEHYARSLWRVLALVSEPGSIDFRVVPGLRRDEVLADPGLLEAGTSAPDWWCPIGPS
ncbi:hypothetical protein SAMN05428985_104214 [Nocardioides sp. YR527]|uniref:hypothetical protein n=1 Tax=Nocardioides sp. YR527 TaxID=1881028 RepID=UPI000887D745|nr:hypothetical protein [Nocardioides sp. YR527]SDK48897.1 hypothetical protein SAMN05428985_104214 [Nocardioides sp. YR527]